MSQADSKKSIYPKTESNPNISAIENEIKDFWQKEGIFEESVDKLPKDQNGGAEYSFFDGPPFANGLPHYGHLLTSAVKDIYARYHTMKGERTERVFGWDCHGLPAEMEAEKELGIQGQIAIQEYGIGEFNDTCRTSVMKYTQEWQDYVSRAGRWVDFENGYKTMDKNYMESVIWAFSELHKKGYVYEGHKVMPYSWACETPLSNFETRMDNAYREKTSKSIYVEFELEENIDSISDNPQVLVAWTTTPWTLPSNLALAVGNQVEYWAIKKEHKTYIVGKNSVSKIAQEIGGVDEDTDIVVVPKSYIKGKKYKPLFPYFANDERGGENAFTILEGDFVTDADGTGIVHLAPGFGEDDQRVCQENGICLPKAGIICPVDEAGRYSNEIFDIEGDEPLTLKGLNVMKAKEKCDAEPYSDAQMEKYGLVNLRITNYLKLKGQLIKQEDYIHNYPHCWRTDTPLIYKAVPSWYVEVTKFKDRMVELNQKINWIPDHIRDGQFGKWLENAHDWAISRNRFWGAPIPVWKTPSGKMKVFGSIAEMEEFFGVEVNDLHRPFIDELTAVDAETGETYTRVSEVLDCWFESGSMPFAELHYPFENEDKFKSRFPADFIVEYVAQTRGWFYTLMVLSTALFDEIPFKNCICHGVILGEPVKNVETGKMEKQKLSKRLRNYPDPLEAFEQYGADAIRWMMVSSPIMNGGELSIAKDGSDIHEVVRLVIKPIWNAYHFFTLYANSDEIKAELRFDSVNLMDQYILSKLKVAVTQVDNSLETYNTADATQAVEDFFEVLNNWYIRRSRERFWRSTEEKEGFADKKAAYDTLYTCLVTILKVASPIAPFISEYIFKNLTGDKSVHLQEFPEVPEIEYNEVFLRNDMGADSSVMTYVVDFIRSCCNTGLSIRNAENIRIRQPLKKVTIYSDNNGCASFLELDVVKNILKEELNVKEVDISSNLSNKAELTLKINFPVLGKRLPDKMKQIIPASKKGEWKLLDNGVVEILGEELLPEEFEVKLQSKDDKSAVPLSTNDALVALDLNVTDELKKEGIARDIVRLIQQARKDADLNISDHIDLVLSNLEGEVRDAVEVNRVYIAEQTLSANIHINSSASQLFKRAYPLGDAEIEIGFDVTVREVA